MIISLVKTYGMDFYFLSGQTNTTGVLCNEKYVFLMQILTAYTDCDASFETAVPRIL